MPHYEFSANSPDKHEQHSHANKANYMKEIPLNERIIFALDFADPDTARSWVRKLDGRTGFFKVGLQLFLAGGWSMVDYITGRGNRVMLDLKFFDIPATVQRAVEQLNNHGVTFATVHGNDPVIRAAIQGRGDVRILAVTVLTSFDESDMREMGFAGDVAELVRIRAKKALELGCDGIVSSPLEAAALRKKFGSGFFIVTPGIRPGLNRDTETDDQRRIATAKQAIMDGADHVVIGRPISRADEPLKMVDSIQKEIEEALCQRCSKIGSPMTSRKDET